MIQVANKSDTPSALLEFKVKRGRQVLNKKLQVQSELKMSSSEDWQTA